MIQYVRGIPEYIVTSVPFKILRIVDCNRFISLEDSASTAAMSALVSWLGLRNMRNVGLLESSSSIMID